MAYAYFLILLWKRHVVNFHNDDILVGPNRHKYAQPVLGTLTQPESLGFLPFSRLTSIRCRLEVNQTWQNKRCNPEPPVQVCSHKFASSSRISRVLFLLLSNSLPQVEFLELYTTTHFLVRVTNSFFQSPLPERGPSRVHLS